MGYVDPSQVRPKFTSSIIANYRASNSPTSLLQSKFKPKTTDTLYIEWNVQRVGETVATDVLRGSSPNINKFDKLTHKVDTPPYFYEALNVTQMTGYDRAFPDNGKIDVSAYNNFRETFKANMQEVINTIERNRELMALGVYTDGILRTRVNGNTDFERNSASIIGYNAAWDWTIDSVDPRVILEAACIYQRAYGQTDDAEFDCYLASDAYSALINNPFIVEAEKFHVNVLTEGVGRRADGSILRRKITAGQFEVNIITYPQVYTPYGTTDLTGAAKVPYLVNGTMIVTPMNAMFQTVYSRPPMLPAEVVASMGSNFMGGIIGTIDKRYYIGEYFDVQRRGWYATVESCFMTIPIAKDQIFNGLVTPP